MRALGLAAVLAALLALPSAAQARRCTGVRVLGIAAVNLHASSISCTNARAKVRSWIRQGYFPKSRSGWYCLFGHRVNPNGYLCSGPRGIAIIDFDVRE